MSDLVRLVEQLTIENDRLKSEITNLHAIEQGLWAAFDATNHGILVTDTDDRVFQMNRMAEELTGWSESNAKGQPSDKVFRIKDSSACKVHEEGAIVGLLNACDGNERQITYSAVPVFSDQGEPSAVVRVFHDVTTTDPVSKALLKSEEKFAKVFRNSSCGIGITRLVDGAFIEGNEAFTDITGYSPEEVSGRTSINLGLWVDSEQRSRLVTELKDRGQVLNQEVLFRKKDGQIISLLFSMVLIKLGGETCIISSFKDITKLKQAEEARRVIVECSLNALIILQEGRIVFANPRAEIMSGYSVQELLDMENPIRTLIHPADIADIMARLAQRASGEVLSPSVIYRIVQKGGQTRWVESYTTQLEFEGKPADHTVYIDITERKRAERELRVAQEFSNGIINTAQAIIVLLDFDGTIRFFNPYLESVSGYTLSDTKGKNWFDVFLPERNREEIRMSFATAIGDTPTRGAVNVIITRDGQERLIEWYDKVLRDADGRVDGLLCVGQDVTVRELAIKALRESEERFRFVFDNAADSILLLEIMPDGGPVIRDVNRATIKTLGYKREELLDKPIEFIDAAPDASRVCAERRAQISSRKGSFLFEAQHRCKDGSIRDFACAVTELQLGSKTFSVSVERDVTELKRIEEALRKSEANLSNALQMAQAGHWEYDVPKDLFTFNDNFYRVFRTTAEAVGGCQMSSAEYTRRFCHSEDSPLVTKEIRAATETRDEGYCGQFEHRIFYADGEIGVITVRFFIEKDAAGRTVRMYGVTQDITERKHAEEEHKALQAGLAQSDRLASMGMLAAGVAHEINNPLAYVLYNLESLCQELPGLTNSMNRCYAILQEKVGAEDIDEHPGGVFTPAMFEEILELAKDALSGTHRIKDITRGLGTFSHVELDEFSEVDLHSAIECAVSLGFNEIKYRARIVKDYGEVPSILASDGRISQVFLNLLINASHAIDEGDVENNEIRIRTWARGNDVFAEVSDTGKGIPPENMEKLFEPFFTTKDIGVGSGLGLAICRNIVTSFGGDIRVESEVDRGTRFTIRLPARRETNDAVRKEQPVAQEPTLSVSGRILVVDDEKGIRTAITRILKRHEVVAVASGVEGQSLLRMDQDFDLILCDMMMPTMSGMDLHEWLSMHNPELAKRMVFVTGGAFTPKAHAYLNMIGVTTIDKPFDMMELNNLVDERINAAKGKRI